jgi:hypothetical protein
MNHTECLFVAKSRISPKEKETLAVNDGWPTSVFIPEKMEERPQCIQMHNASNINNHGFIFQF